MQTHLKTIQWASITAVALFAASIMTSNYLLALGVLMFSFVIGVAYLIAVSEFEKPPAHPRRTQATAAARD